MTPPGPIPPRWRSELIAAPIVLLLAVLLYGPGVQGYFVSDDYLMLSAAERLHALSPLAVLREVFASEYYSQLEIRMYRPLWVLTFYLQSFVSGTDYASYIAVDILLHAANALLLTSIVAAATGRTFAAVLAGTLFTAGAMHADAVLWLVSRYALMATFFSLLALRLWIAGGRRRRLAVLAVVAALLSGEQGIAAPPLLAAWSLLFPDQVRGGGLFRRVAVALRETWLLWLLVLLYLLVRRAVLGTLLGGYPGSDKVSILSTWFVWSRLALIDAVIAPVHGVHGPPAAKPALRLLGLVLAALVLVTARRRGARGAGGGDAFLWLWLLLAFVPIFAVGVQPDTMRDTRLVYQPALAWFALVALGVDRFAGWAGGGRPASWLRAALAAGLLAVQISMLVVNRRPWVEAPRLSAAIHERLRPYLQQRTRRPLAIADIPGIHDGAYLGLAGNTMMFAPQFVGFRPARPLRVYVNNELDTELRLDIKNLVSDLDVYRTGALRVRYLNLARICGLDLFPWRASGRIPVPFARDGFVEPLDPIEFVSVRDDGEVRAIPIRPPAPVDVGQGLRLRVGHASPRRLAAGGRLNVGLRIENPHPWAVEVIVELRRRGLLCATLPLWVPPGSPVTVGRSFRTTPPVVPGRYEVAVGGVAIAEVEVTAPRR
jgi:hypothetical protein